MAAPRSVDPVDDPMTDTLTDPRDAEAAAAFRHSPPTAMEAWLAVMDEVRAVAKDGLYEAGKTKYPFRGIDGVINAVGPVVRTHRVNVRPVAVSSSYRDVEAGANRTMMRESTVMVTYRVTGPAGDYFDSEVPGEALDSSDKGTAKAMSVAYRIFLLQSLMIPTHEPDPDESRYERASVPEYVEQQAVPGLRTAIQGAIDKLDEDQKADLKVWFATEDLPPVRRMNEAQCERVLDHLFTLPAPTPDPEEEGK